MIERAEREHDRDRAKRTHLSKREARRAARAVNQTQRRSRKHHA